MKSIQLMEEEIKRLRDENDQLKADNEELRKRPRAIVITKLQNGDRLLRSITGERAKKLRPGSKYELTVEFQRDKDADIEVYEFHTPMMLVKTPEVIVRYAEASSYVKDDMVVLEIKKNDDKS